jgi:hypothetical protein
MAIIVPYANDLPDPGGHERDSHETQSQKGPGSALPLLVVEDFLQSVAAGDL